MHAEQLNSTLQTICVCGASTIFQSLCCASYLTSMFAIEGCTHRYWPYKYTAKHCYVYFDVWMWALFFFFFSGQRLRQISCGLNWFCYYGYRTNEWSIGWIHCHIQPYPILLVTILLYNNFNWWFAQHDEIRKCMSDRRVSKSAWWSCICVIQFHRMM